MAPTGNYYYVRDNSENFKLSEDRSAGLSRYKRDDKWMIYSSTYGLELEKYHDACHEVEQVYQISEAKSLINKYLESILKDL